LDTGFVAYSLGNFISNQRWRYSDGGLVLNFEITKNIFTDSIYISGVNYLPIWLFKGITKRGRDYILIPSSDSTITNNFEFMTEADIDSMHKSYYDTVNQLTSKSDYPN
jgi:poly-gamma-glutamate synthesis protein (capsule biosynthesis protein)